MFWCLLMLLNLSLASSCPKDIIWQLEDASSNRILGGEPCKRNQWPFVVEITIGSAGNCTGSIIDDRYILTASHCLIGPKDISMKPLKPQAFTVHVSSVHFDNASVFEVEKVVPHSGFNKKGDHDIGLLKLKTPISNAYGVFQGICLYGSHPRNIHKPKDALVIGYGVTAQGPRRNVKNHQHPTFGDFYTDRKWIESNSGGSCYYAKIPVQKDTYCSVHKERNHLNFQAGRQLCGGGVWKGTLKGDSGGPLISQVNNRYFQIGVTARGITLPDAQGNPTDVGVYTRVARYCDWIFKNTENKVECV